MQVLDTKRPKARKEHTCDYCGKKIAVGEEYQYSKMVHDRQIYSWHECDRCKDYVFEVFVADWCRCQTEGLTDNIFQDYMTEKHPDIAKEWWG